MPVYDFACACGRITESRESLDTQAIKCGCGKRAVRVPVYREQYMSAETGPKGGSKSEPPREEKSYRKQYNEFTEASAELNYAYVPESKRKNYYKEGVKQARKRGAKIASN
jgi:hypothetical protein